LLRLSCAGTCGLVVAPSTGVPGAKPATAILRLALVPEISSRRCGVAFVVVSPPVPDPAESMSGICGIVNFNGTPVDPGVLDRMVQAAAHRGPDGVGRWLNGKIGLANLRMNITPESVRERQPQASPDDAFVVTASARIDYRDDLIAALRGFVRTAEPTDADLILAAYGKWGEDCASHLIGDYAFAIWDARREILFAARDPMGFRALYFRREPGRLIFATEAHQLLVVPGVPSEIYEPAMAMHLAMATETPPDRSFYDGISQLPAGHALLSNHASHRTWRFWDVDPDRRTEYSAESDYFDHFRELFKQAVSARLRSTKPVGVWLSGGLDSGSVASTAGWLQRNGSGHATVHAYSWTFETLKECDERHISNRIAEHYGMPVGYVSAEDFAPFSGRAPVVTHPDEPFVQVYSPLLQQALMQARADGVGSILSGFRGDPMAESGDFDYLDLLLAGRWLRVWKHLALYRRRVPTYPMGRLLQDRFIIPFGEAVLWSRPVAWAAFPVREALLGGRKPFPARPYPTWIESSLANRVDLRRRMQQPRPPVNIRGLARKTRYRSIFFPKFFRAAVEQERHNASAGIGYADPWSDRRLAEFILSVPQHVLSRIGDEKRVTRQAMRGVMPEDARLAARKIVPSPLFDRVMRKDACAQITDLFTGSQLAARGFIAEGRLRDSYQSFLQGGPNDPRIWPAVTAELWLRRHWN
jgi:asparagine synthase (glutamine-hydrolysing)